jgi:ribosomal protein L4
LEALEIGGSALFVTTGTDRNLTLASRNVQDVEVTSSESLTPYQVLRYDKLIFTRSALEQVGQRLTR